MAERYQRDDTKVSASSSEITPEEVKSRHQIMHKKPPRSSFWEQVCPKRSCHIAPSINKLKYTHENNNWQLRKCTKETHYASSSCENIFSSTLKRSTMKNMGDKGKISRFLWDRIQYFLSDNTDYGVEWNNAIHSVIGWGNFSLCKHTSIKENNTKQTIMIIQ